MYASHPTDIGPYRVLEVLGQGGVGTVYLVQQREPFRRKAALKLVKLGMDTREVLVRFAQERQMLAQMNHPNIAKVFDAGQTDTGRPYFVMEYVAGESITDYCDARRLSVRERLGVFVTLCEALHHAHQRGILHRDVKPSNVLVSEREGRHVPVVIDFGLAKVLRGEPASAHLLTRDGQFLGTPRYVSPEQIELASDAIDARSDVYSLGVVLFELLVGEPPNERPDTDGGLPRLLRAVREEESTRPSTRISRLRGSDDVATKRATDSAALHAQVRGDLDWIVVKALERDRERRYGSAAELAADIERYLRREPVLARSPSAGYRIERFVRRRPLVVGAMLAVVLALAVATAASTFWYFSANAARETKAALLAMCDGIRTDVADAHYWLEKAVADDESANVERDVIAKLEGAVADVSRALEGAEPSLEQRAAREPEIADKLHKLRAELDQLVVIARRRWEAREDQTGAEAGMDAPYDAFYKRTQAVCIDIVRTLQERSARDWRLAASCALAVNAALVLVLVVSSAGAVRFWLKRA